VQPLPYVSTKQAKVNTPLTYNDIPTREIISQALGLTNPLLTSIILFISSSGTGRAETLNLTIGDFLESVQEYTYETDIYKVLVDLHSRNDIVPMFKLKRQKTNQYYYTFCSPEATSSIIDYLLTRKDILMPSKRLFKIDKKYLSDLLRELNDQLGLGKKGGFRVLRCHMLRKYHATQLSNEENSLTETDIDFLQGRSDSKTRQSYFFTDEKKLKRRYAESMNAVTIYNQYNVLVDANNDLFIEVHDPHDDIVPLQERVVQLGKENSLLRSENKEIRESVKAEAKKVFMELLRENNIEL
jgi:integrase